MTREEAIQKMEEFGYTNDEIRDVVALHDEAESEGIKISWELNVIEKVVDD